MIVLINGGMISIDTLKAAPGPVAIVEASYPGFYGAQTIAKAVFGQINRWGKNTVTIFKAEQFGETDDGQHAAQVWKPGTTFDMVHNDPSLLCILQAIPAADSASHPCQLDFSMQSPPGRTYRYFKQQPLWKFGAGLSLTSFALQDTTAAGSKALLSGDDSASVTLSLNVSNTGGREGDEVVMVFISPPASLRSAEPARMLQRQLVAFERIHLPKGASTSLAFKIGLKELQLHDSEGNTVVYGGDYKVSVTNGNDGERESVEHVLSVKGGYKRLVEAFDK